MILAEDLKWLTDRWLSLVNEIVNALRAGHQFVLSPIGRYCRSGECQFFGMMLSHAGRSGVATDEGSPTST
jgi:hypothetical protein